jgi:hypothetical protein
MFTYDTNAQRMETDGKRVKSVMGSETTLFIGAHYEIQNPGSGLSQGIRRSQPTKHSYGKYCFNNCAAN